jgi:aspartyl-tRNA(Asn)/glutamyl-tRNA(Gln) amidotransferase subunit A
MSGIAPLALSTDAGGSTRRPASHVGCVGLKPSLGRVPRRNGFPALASDLQTLGAMARAVKDLRLLFNCIAVPAAPAPAADAPSRIGAFCRIGAAPVEPEVERAWHAARAVLAALGHRIVEIEAPYDPDEVGELFTGLAAVGVARVLQRFPDWKAKVTPPIAQLASKGREIAATTYVELIDRVASFRAHLADQFADVDLFLTPTAAGLLWPKAESFPKLIAGREAAPRASAIYTTFVNLAGLSAISLPAGRSAAGHPIGVQLIGPPGSDERILDVAERFEQAQPWPLLALDAGSSQAPAVRSGNEL